MSDVKMVQEKPINPSHHLSIKTLIYIVLLLCLLNIGLWLFIVHEHYYKPASVPVKAQDIVYKSIVQYQWVKKVSDPLDAWRISHMYFDAGYVKEAQAILCQAYKNISSFSDAAWLWEDVLSEQIKRLQDYMQDKPIAEHKVSSWTYWGITVQTVRKDDTSSVNDFYYTSDNKTIIRQHYMLTESVVGSVTCGF